MVDTGVLLLATGVAGSICLLPQNMPTEKSSTGGPKRRTPGFTTFFASGLRSGPADATGAGTSSGLAGGA